MQTLNREHGKTIVMVTPDPKAAACAAHTIHLDKGELIDQVAHASESRFTSTVFPMLVG